MNTPKEITNDKKRIGGADIAAMILAGEYERLYLQFSEEMKNLVMLEEFRSMGQQFVEGIDSFQLTSDLRINGYESWVWSDPSGDKGLTATIDGKGLISGMQINNHSKYPETDEAYSKTVFDLPFEGDWLVFWGGNDIFVNYHYEYEHNRYAYDLVKEKNGYTYEGNPKLNSSYYAFGGKVFAPADGVVVQAVDGIIDNEPVGMMNEQQPAGNSVTLQHANGEYSTIAHLKKGSVQVKAGDNVKAGQLIGLCGNSGNSSEPHIHFQVSAQQHGGKTIVIPPSFRGGLQPIRGDSVSGTITQQ
ncbi:M23 family metallopeptidase [Paenibacillus ihuae]|uniref:M23 family metallopeptidase n=1 Tax=Paenibacillus ihuae TaxID=1232431 RepID=UPI0011DD0A29|nr:M23 family metallopeptidase [Paenibacillus ihuae]